MQFRNLWHLAIISGCVLTLSTFAQAPLNLSSAKANIINYYNSGEYNKDVQKSAQQAETYLQQAIANNKNSNQKLAIILDIDDTALLGYHYAKKYDFGGTMPYLNELWTNNHTPIPEILTLYKKAQKDHVAVFFISGRPHKYLQPTIKNLKKAGYTNWTGLIETSNKHKLTDSIVPVKTAARKEIANKGYKIILTVGDQPSDIEGRYVGKTVKLPNPMYSIS